MPSSWFRTIALVAVGVLCGSVPALVLAGVPHTFANGQVASAAEVNANFVALDARLAMLEAPLPAFLAYNTNCAGSQSGDVVWQAVSLNNGGHYNAATGRFTAPVAGVYSFTAAVQLYGLGSGSQVSFKVNNVVQAQNSYDDNAPASEHETVPLAAALKLNAGDTVNVSAGYVRNCQSWFTGHLVR